MARSANQGRPAIENLAVTSSSRPHEGQPSAERSSECDCVSGEGRALLLLDGPSCTGDQWQLDRMRTLRTCSWRAVIWAPVAHYFWLALEVYVSPAVAHLGLTGTFIKILLDFATVAPPLVYSFLCWSKFWETCDVDLAIQHANAKAWSTLLPVYCYWAPLHVMTYGFVPLRHRIAWVSICSIGFGSLLSYCNNST